MQRCYSNKNLNKAMESYKSTITYNPCQRIFPRYRRDVFARLESLLTYKHP